MLSGRGLCDELITCPEESYRLWCVVLCDLMNSCTRRQNSLNCDEWPADMQYGERDLHAGGDLIMPVCPQGRLPASPLAYRILCTLNYD